MADTATPKLYQALRFFLFMLFLIVFSSRAGKACVRLHMHVEVVQ